jgi:nickel-dependent lactate racemase
VLVSPHRSAFRHGLTAEDIEHAWTTGAVRQVRLEDDHPERVLRVGTDSAGRPIEVVALVFDQDRILIIHAMKARKVALDATERRTQ